MNGINPSTPLMVGMSIFIPPRPKRTAEILAYVEPRGNTVSESLVNQAREAGPYLTYLALFSFHANRDGTLTAPPINPLPSVAAQTNASNFLI